MKLRWINLLLALAIVFATFSVVSASPSSVQGDGDTDAPDGLLVGDNLKHPLGARNNSLRQLGLEMRLMGQAPDRVVRVGKGDDGGYVELDQIRNDRIFVIIAEFGDQIHPSYGGLAGPQHNQIPEPDRSMDNSTIWQPDFNSDHYRDMYFNQMLNYYRMQSSGRYSFNGDVTEWVRVPYNEARYGANYCGGIVCSTTWYLIRDSINIWVADRLAEGMTLDQIRAYLSTFDVWDRYDADGDGNFDEADGYIDHFQIVHAGEGEETGGGAQGSNAIWSHRWYTAFQGLGVWGPPGSMQGGMEFGGAGTFAQEGGPNAVGVWVGDYTIQPENGGLGVFAHEYGHDLGLPDLYDTAGNTCGSACENSTGFWTLMSSGSYLNGGTTDIGSRPGDLGAWEKFQLGWLNYDVAFAGDTSKHILGPAEFNTAAKQGLFVVLPDKERVLELGTPFEGAMMWWSDAGDNLDQMMTRSVDVPAGSSTLTMQLNYNIEQDWDYAYVAVSTDGGASWTNLPDLNGHTTNDSPNGQNFGNGITGISGGWVEAAFDMSAYGGQSVMLQLRYWTDGAVQGSGLLADAISLGGFFDGAESGENGWTLNGFRATSGRELSFHFNAYVAENRQYVSYDTGLQTGAYNFGFLNTMPNWVERFPYQDGLLVSYWDSSVPDNSTSAHPGEGLILPIDADPEPLIRADGNPWRARIQSYDLTFGFWRTDAITLHFFGDPSFHRALPAVREFSDLRSYWSPQTPTASVIVPQTGTALRVIRFDPRTKYLTVMVRPAR